MIGKRISELRKKKGITQLQLATMLGITDKAVSKWERGLTCPDISLLTDIASVLSVSTDVLLSDDQTPDAADSFISIEKYFMGSLGYYVPDFHPKDEKILLILDSPDVDESKHGFPLSASCGKKFNKYIFGKDDPFTIEELQKNKLGITYVSNVPLWNLDNPIGQLVDELEYIRLNKYHTNLFLLQNFVKKMSEIITCETLEIIALTREFNQKYFGAFISYANPKIISLFYEKIQSKKLTVLFVGTPHYWNKEKELYDLPTFRKLCLKHINLQNL